MSSLKKVVASTSRDVEHLTITYKKRTKYVLECGHETTRETDRSVAPSARLKCKTCAAVDPTDAPDGTSEREDG